MRVDREQWSGEGDFTEQLLIWLSGQPTIERLRVEDASSARSDVEYNFVSNEIYIKFKMREREQSSWLLGFIPIKRSYLEKMMTLEQLDNVLADDVAMGAPDYADDGMIQYLRTERIIPPYQTKGYKLIELVRIYEMGTESQE